MRVCQFRHIRILNYYLVIFTRERQPRGGANRLFLNCRKRKNRIQLCYYITNFKSLSSIFAEKRRCIKKYTSVFSLDAECLFKYCSHKFWRFNYYNFQNWPLHINYSLEEKHPPENNDYKRFDTGDKADGQNKCKKHAESKGAHTCAARFFPSEHFSHLFTTILCPNQKIVTVLE